MLSSSISDYYASNMFVLLINHRKKKLKKEKKIKSRPSSSCHLELWFCTAQCAVLQEIHAVMMYCLLSTTIHLYVNQDIISREMSQPYLKAGATVKTSKSWVFREVRGLAQLRLLNPLHSSSTRRTQKADV